MDVQQNLRHTKKSKKRMNLAMYNMLSASGELDVIKSHIRSKLILELNKGWSKPGANAELIQFGNYYTNLANKLIISQLMFHQYHYTLSVFVPECSLPQNEVYYLGHDGQPQLLQPVELLSELKALRLPRVRNKMIEDQSPMEWLLRFLDEDCAHSFTCTATQTGEDLPYEYYDDKLRNIDQQYEHRRHGELQSTRKTFEQQLDKVRLEMEAQYTKKLSHQMDQFRESKIAELEHKIEEKYRLLLNNSEKKLQEDYERRLAKLAEDHKQVQHKTELARQADEREAFMRRQNMQAEVEALRTRLSELKEEKQQLNRKRLEMETEYKNRQVELELREKNLTDKEQSFENRVRDEVKRLRIEDEQRARHREKEQEYKTVELEEDHRQLEREKQFVKELKTELMKQKSKFSDMEVADYQMIKSQNSSLKAEAKCLREQLDDAIKTIQEQKRQLFNLQSESATFHTLNVEVEELRKTLVHVREEFDEERRQLTTRIIQQKTRMQQLVQQLTLGTNENDPLGQTFVHSHPPLETYTTQTARNQTSLPYTEEDKEALDIFPAGNQREISSQVSSGLHDTRFDQWANRLTEARQRMNRLKMESEQMETAFDRWCVSNPSSVVRLEYEQLVNRYLNDKNPQNLKSTLVDVSCAISPRVGAMSRTAVFSIAHGETREAPKHESGHIIRAHKSAECLTPSTAPMREDHSQLSNSKGRVNTTSSTTQSREGVTLVYDDTGVSARTHTSRSELSIEIDDRLRPQNKQDVAAPASSERSPSIIAVDSPRALNSHQSTEHHKSPMAEIRQNTEKSARNTYREENSDTESDTDRSTNVIEELAAFQLDEQWYSEEESTLSQNVSSGCCENQFLAQDHHFDTGSQNDKKSTEDEDTAKEEDKEVADMREDEEEEKEEESQTPKPVFKHPGDNSSADELMQRYLELSKTTNRVSEAARIEEETEALRQAESTAEEKTKAQGLAHFLNNPKFNPSDSDTNSSECEQVPELDNLSTGGEQSDPSDPVW